MLKSKEISKGIVQAVLILSGIALSAGLLYQIRTLFIYIALAFVLALIGKPLVDFLYKKCKLKKMFAISITMGFFIAVFIGFSFMFVPLFTTQAQNLSVLNTAHLQE